MFLLCSRLSVCKHISFSLHPRLQYDSLVGMKRLIEQRYVVRQNLVAVVGVCLSIYFCYHLIAGERSYLRLISLNFQQAQTEVQLAQATQEREALEQRVTMMRPGSVNADLLEEQARKVLGFSYDDEKLIIKN
jgi:cell division protein FtsB